MKVFVLLIVTIITIIGMVIIYFECTDSHYHALRKDYEFEKIITCEKCIAYIYKTTGFLYNNNYEFKTSKYCPNEVDIMHTYHGNRLSIVSQIENRTNISVIASELIKNDSRRLIYNYREDSFPIYFPGDRTKCRIDFYLSGKKHIVIFVESIRSSMHGYLEVMILQINHKNYHGKQLKVPELIPLDEPMISHDLPSTKSELSIYIKWLCTIEGVNSLTDEWGNEIHFYFEGNYLIARSAGPDKKFGTSDDIIIKELYK